MNKSISIVSDRKVLEQETSAALLKHQQALENHSFNGTQLDALYNFIQPNGEADAKDYEYSIAVQKFFRFLANPKASKIIAKNLGSSYEDFVDMLYQLQPFFENMHSENREVDRHIYMVEQRPDTISDQRLREMKTAAEIKTAALRPHSEIVELSKVA